MQYNVAQLLQSPTGAVRRYAIDEPASEVQVLLREDNISVEGPLHGDVTFMRSTDGILVMGHLDLTVALVCDRCLETFQHAIALDLEETFRPTIDIRTGATLPRVQGEETATLISAQHILDLSEVVRQGILLAAPMHPVCRLECVGLCPQCGQNLNEGPCDCKTETIDPRWAKLQALLNEMETTK